jgi:hypothetical protein
MNDLDQEYSAFEAIYATGEETAEAAFRVLRQLHPHHHEFVQMTSLIFALRYNALHLKHPKWSERRLVEEVFNHRIVAGPAVPHP